MSDPLQPTTEGFRVLVVDDEAHARQRILTLLEREEDVAAEAAASGTEAIEMLRSEEPPIDIVFLDVQMPGATGLDVVRAVGPEAMPVTIFVTAYDQHAVAAFELAALDYLLKPFENERFGQALERARDIVRLQKTGALHERLLTLLQTAGAKAAPEPEVPKYLERIAVEMRGQIRVVPVDRVDYVTVDGNYVKLHAGDDTFLVNETLSALERRLNPEAFFRIHRSTIVRLDRVEALLTAPGGHYSVRLQDQTRLKVARGRRDALAERLGIDV